MARGLAREQSRAKGLEKRQGGKGKDDGLTPAQRTERDAAALAAKKAKKEAQRKEMAQTADGKAKIAAEDARKKAQREAKNDRTAVNRNPQAVKQNGAKNLTAAARDAKAAAAQAARDRAITAAGQKPGGKAGAGGGAAKSSAADQLKEIERQLMPKVKQADAKVAEGDQEGLEAAILLYQEAMAGFQAKGYKRPKLQVKLDKAKEALAALEEEAEC